MAVVRDKIICSYLRGAQGAVESAKDEAIVPRGWHCGSGAKGNCRPERALARHLLFIFHLKTMLQLHLHSPELSRRRRTFTETTGTVVLMSMDRLWQHVNCLVKIVWYCNERQLEAYSSHD